jgi:hypothetical protein
MSPTADIVRAADSRANAASLKADAEFLCWLETTFAAKGQLDQNADLVTLGLLSLPLQDAVHRYQAALRELRDLTQEEG